MKHTIWFHGYIEVTALDWTKTKNFYITLCSNPDI